MAGRSDSDCGSGSDQGGGLATPKKVTLLRRRDGAVVPGRLDPAERTAALVILADVMADELLTEEAAVAEALSRIRRASEALGRHEHSVLRTFHESGNVKG